jgi:predicted methyltransferase
LADPLRSDEHRARDSGRLPLEVLNFAFGPDMQGMRVADLVPGDGYYSAILSRLVGDTGAVYAVNPIRIFQAFPQARAGFPKYLSQDPRDNIRYSVQKLDELIFAEPLDAALMVLYYHDTYWTKVDRAAMNQRIFNALKPGGLYLIVDHHAPEGAPDEVTQSLHRMDAAHVKPEVAAAGFEFVRASDLLANAADPRTESVFKPELRGHTDRFIYLFRKPVK